MESKARLVDIAKDWRNGKFRLTFELDSFLPNMVDAIKDCCLRLSVKKWKEKRSLDANAYMWVLFTKMATILQTTAQEIHDEMLYRYGIPDEDEDGYISIAVRSRIDIARIEGYWKLYKESRDGKYKYYYRIKGTSELDTGEMSWFLQRGIDEAEELGIETATPDQIREMEALWERNRSRAEYRKTLQNA